MTFDTYIMDTFCTCCQDRNISTDYAGTWHLLKVRLRPQF